MSNVELAKEVVKSPTMPRDFLEDVVSIKVAETETLLEDKLQELQAARKEQEAACERAIKALLERSKADAQEQAGGKLKAIVDAFAASDMFPALEYSINGSYGASRKERSDEQEYGVPVSIHLKRNKRAESIARGGLPMTTTTSQRNDEWAGLTVIAATTALIKVTPEVRELQLQVDAENDKKATLTTQIEKIEEYLAKMGSSERKIRAAVARNHLNSSAEGKSAIEFLDSIGLPQALGKDVVKALPDLK